MNPTSQPATQEQGATPRTDAEAESWEVSADAGDYVGLDFARALERDNARLLADCERMRGALDECLTTLRYIADRKESRSVTQLHLGEIAANRLKAIPQDIHQEAARAALRGQEQAETKPAPPIVAEIPMPKAAGFNPVGLTDADVGQGWALLNENEPLRPGDGFLKDDLWIDYTCRPDIFRGSDALGCPVREYVHTWPWRRKIRNKKAKP